MTEVVTQLSNPTWWLSVVVAGVVVSVLASYFRSILDRMFAHTSRWWGTRTEAKRQERIALVSSLTGDHHKQLVQLHFSLVERVRSVFWLLFAVVLILLQPTSLQHLFGLQKVLLSATINVFIAIALLLSTADFIRSVDSAVVVVDALEAEEKDGRREEDSA